MCETTKGEIVWQVTSGAPALSDTFEKVYLGLAKALHQFKEKGSCLIIEVS